jgi:hypothetical protein
MTNSDNTPGASTAPVTSGAPQAQPSPEAPLIWALLNAAFLVIFAIPLIWELAPATYTWLAGQKAQGIVYLVQDCHDTDDNGKELYEQTFLYKDAQGQLQESTSGSDCRNEFTDGQAVSVWYLPSEPGSVLFDDGSQIAIFVFTIGDLAIMLVMLGYLLRYGWALVKACGQVESFKRLLWATLGCLVIFAPLLGLLHFWPPPSNQDGNGPTHNFHLGQTVIAENRWAVTIQSGQVGVIHTTDAGKVCLELNITLRNVTHQTLPFQANQFTLLDAQIKPRSALCQADTPALGNATLTPGAALTATNFYEVPASPRQFYLAFRPDPQDEDNTGRYFWTIQATQSVGELEQWQGQAI